MIFEDLKDHRLYMNVEEVEPSDYSADSAEMRRTTIIYMSL